MKNKEFERIKELKKSFGRQQIAPPTKVIRNKKGKGGYSRATEKGRMDDWLNLYYEVLDEDDGWE